MRLSPMPIRRRLVFLVATAGLSTFAALHCGGETSSGSSGGSSGDATSSGTGNNTSSGANVTSSGGGSGTSGTSTSSGEEPPPPPARIERAQNLPTRSAGCGQAPPDRGSDVNVEGGRKYIPYQGWNYSTNGLGDRGYPVLIALHGCGAYARNFGEFVKFEEVIGDEGLVVYADAAHPNGNYGGCDWQVGSDTEVEYLDRVIASVSSQFCVDPSRVAVLGYSWGSYQAHHYACTRPGTVKAVIGAAGGYPDWTANADTRACGQIPTLIYGRTHDNNEQISKSYNARDKKLTTNECQNSPSAAGAPFAGYPDAQVSGCVDYPGCVDGVRMTFCEDSYNFANASWNHTLWQPYRRPLWEWFTGLP